MELDGLCCTERYWLPLHAAREKARPQNEGPMSHGCERKGARIESGRALARIEPRNPPNTPSIVVKGRRCIVRLSYSDDVETMNRRTCGGKIHVRLCGGLGEMRPGS